MSRTPFHISSDCGNTRGRWLVGGTLQPPSFLPRSIKIGPFAGIRVRNGGSLLPPTPTGRPTPNPREVRGNPSEEWWKSILPLHRLLPPTEQQANAPIQTVTVDSISAIHTQTLFEALVNDQLPKIGDKTKIHLSICWGHQGVRKTGGWLFAVAA